MFIKLKLIANTPIAEQQFYKAYSHGGQLVFV